MQVLLTGILSGIIFFFSNSAFAHKSHGNHSHCSVDGKGVKVQGKTDAERKKACGEIPNAKWDGKKTLKVEETTGDTTTPVEPQK